MDIIKIIKLNTEEEQYVYYYGAIPRVGDFVELEKYPNNLSGQVVMVEHKFVNKKTHSIKVYIK